MYAGSSWEHYLALEQWAAPKKLGEAKFGPAGGCVYCEVWTQRFEGGILVHPARIEDWGLPLPGNFDHSMFIMTDRDEWFADIRPGIQPISDVNTFLAVWRDKASAEVFRTRTANRWEARFPPSSEDELRALYRAHNVGDPRARTLMGGLAAAYAKFDLAEFIGRPVEEAFVQVMLLRAFDTGYVLAPAVRPPFPKDAAAPVAPGAILVAETRDVRPDALDAMYLLKCDSRIISDDLSATEGSAGGERWATGSWTLDLALPPDDEVSLRPGSGFFER